MRRLHWFWLTLVTFAALATACGGGSGGAEDADTIVDDSVVDDSGVDDAPADDSLDAAAALAQAFDSSSTDHYRVETFQATTLQVRGIGLSQATTIDVDRPAVVGLIDGDRTWQRMDLTAMLGDMAAAGDLGFDIWTDPDRMVIDTRSYVVLEELNPLADLGPFRPGVAYVDLAEVATESDDFVAAIAGGGPVSLEVVTERLIASIRELGVSDDGRTFTGVMWYVDQIEAFGGDVDDLARSSAAGLAQVMGVDIERLTAVYTDTYRRSEATIEIHLDEASLLREIRATIDLAHLYERLGEELPALTGETLTPAEEAQVAAMFADAVFELEQLIRFELDPAEVIPEVPAELEDRTAEWVDWMVAAGF